MDDTAPPFPGDHPATTSLTETMKAGFIGVGNMGGAIAERLLRQGVELHVYNADAAALARLERLGAVVHPSSRSVADEVALLCGCLPSVAAARSASFDDDGVTSGKAARYYLEMSTVGPATARVHAERFAANGIHYVDAAVSGGSAKALAGTLVIILAGPPAVLESVRPVLERITDRLLPVGEEPGQAQAMKLINNILVAANMATSSEALAVGSKMGLDPERMFDVIEASSGNSWVMSPWRREAVLSGRFSTGPKLSVMFKDIDLMREETDKAGIPAEALPSLSGAIALWDRARARGMADDDMTTIIRVAETDVGALVRSRTRQDADR